MTSDEARRQAERIFKKEERAFEGASIGQESPGAINNSALNFQDRHRPRVHQTPATRGPFM
jgi:hypothetical protein